MINCRGEIKPRDIVISGGLFILMIFSVVWIISLAASQYPGVVDDTELSAFNETFNKYDEYTSTLSELESRTRNFSAGEGGAFSFLNNLINQGWNTLKLLFQSFGFLVSALEGLSEAFGIPVFIPLLFIAIITAVFVFAVLSVIFGRTV